MSFLITRRPEKLFAGSVKLSRWTALANPYIFELHRKDFAVANVAIKPAFNATLPTIKTNGGVLIVPFFVAAGDTIYVNTGPYQGMFTVFSVSGEHIILDTPYIGPGSGGWVNVASRSPNFKAFIRIYDGVTGEVIDELRPSLDSTGLLLCDVSGVLRSRVVTTANPQQTQNNRANKGISGSFRIGYGATFIFDGVQGSTGETKDSTRYYWLSAARQVTGDVSAGMSGIGQNLKEYVPKNLASSQAKFLTMFERPTYFEGFPFFLSFLYDEDFDGLSLRRHQQDTDINGTDVGSETSTTLAVSERRYVNNMRLRAPNNGTRRIKAWLEVGPPETELYVASGGVASGAASPTAIPLRG